MTNWTNVSLWFGTEGRSVAAEASVPSGFMKGFRFNHEDIWLSTWKAPVATGILYCLVIKYIQDSIGQRGKPPWGPRFRALQLMHNAFLSIVSAVLLVLLAMEVWNVHREVGGGTTGVMRLFCDPRPHRNNTGRLVFYYYLNYLLKYYELLDTVFMALKGKQIIFLHQYHHAATMFLAWVMLDNKIAVQWVAIGINLAIHTFMYYYYYATLLGRKVWWKRYLTIAQIVQFAVILAVGGLVFAMGHSARAGLGWFPGNTWCSGEYGAAYLGFALIISYLVLFLQFYAQVYLAGGRHARKAKLA